VSSYQKLVNVSFKIDVDLLKKLDEYAKSRGTTRSEIIRRALRWYIKSLRPTVTPRMTIYHGYSSNDNNTSRIRFR
jgi:metal-responsive CopG/Arc/MetJ family transcriptional regulator